MNLEQLKYFEEICRSGSISKAAENLYISQQGLSMSMQRLEDHFSCKLFERDSRGMKPSEDGYPRLHSSFAHRPVKGAVYVFSFPVLGTPVTNRSCTTLQSLRSATGTRFAT